MSENTKIEWADSSWNPWIGCTKVSPGCMNCYAEVQTFTRAQRALGKELWGSGKPRHRTSAAMWKQPVKWNENALLRSCVNCKKTFTGKSELASHNGVLCCPTCLTNGQPCELAHRQSRLRVFPSMCDWLDEEVPIEWLADFLRLIYETPHLDWLLLTKRPENFAWRVLEVLAHVEKIRGDWPDREPETDFGSWLNEWTRTDGDGAPANVWVGTSVEDQTRANERIPELLRIPAKVRFLSVEPLLGPVALNSIVTPDAALHFSALETGALVPAHVDWVIVGGESGPKARVCSFDWIRPVVRDCRGAGVPVFVKQLGGNYFDGGRVPLKHKKGGDMEEWPEDLRVREFPGDEPQRRRDAEVGR